MATEEYFVGYEAGYQEGWNAAIDSPQKAQPAPAGEPIAWEATHYGIIKYVTDSRYKKFSATVQGYYKPFKCSSCTAPQPRKPLTDEKADEIALDIMGFAVLDKEQAETARMLIRATEAAHNITGGQA